MAACTPSIHVLLGRPLFLLSSGIHSIINFASLSSCILLTCPYRWSLFLSIMSIMSGSSFTSIISFICSFVILSNLDFLADLLSTSIQITNMKYSSTVPLSVLRKNAVPVIDVAKVSAKCWCPFWNLTQNGSAWTLKWCKNWRITTLWLTISHYIFTFPSPCTYMTIWTNKNHLIICTMFYVCDLSRVTEFFLGILVVQLCIHVFKFFIIKIL